MSTKKKEKDDAFFPFEKENGFSFSEEKTEKKEKTDPNDILEIGAKTLLGVSVGAIAGVTAIAMAASIGEIVIVGGLTKLCGLAGGAMGLTWGLKSKNK